MLEDMVNKLIDLELSAPHSKVEVLGVIQDAWTPADDQSLGRHLRRVNPQGFLRYFNWFATHSSQYHLRCIGREAQN